MQLNHQYFPAGLIEYQTKNLFIFHPLPKGIVMLRLAPLTLAVLVLVLIGNAQNEKGKKDKGKKTELEGTWNAVKVTENGEVMPKTWLKAAKFVIKGNRIRGFYPNLRRGPKKSTESFTINSNKMPKQINITELDDTPLKGLTHRGIFRLEKDRLIICLPHQPNRDRPKEFSAVKGSKQTLIILKRAKK